AAEVVAVGEALADDDVVRVASEHDAVSIEGRGAADVRPPVHETREERAEPNAIPLPNPAADLRAGDEVTQLVRAPLDTRPGQQARQLGRPAPLAVEARPQVKQRGPQRKGTEEENGAHEHRAREEA